MLVVRPHEIGSEPQQVERTAQRADNLAKVSARGKTLAAVFGVVAVRVAPFAGDLGKLGRNRHDAIDQFRPIGCGAS